jgi:hypothetical protein
MKTEELRSLQAPLKERYRERPETALVILRTEGRIGTNISCKFGTGRALVEAGLHPHFRGTLGVSKDTPVGFQRIRLDFDLATDASEDQIATLIRLTERYCVVYQTLRQCPDISISHGPREV